MSTCTWTRVAFHDVANIRGCTFRCPSTSRYAGYEFTHPESMIDAGHGGCLVIRFPGTWVFRLRHRTKPPVELSAAEFEAAFRNDTADQLAAHDPRAPFLEVREPEPLAPVAVSVLGDLRNE